MSAMNPSVVTDPTLALNFSMLCKHSPITLLINEVVQEAKIGLDNSVADILNNLPVLYKNLVVQLFLLLRMVSLLI